MQNRIIAFEPQDKDENLISLPYVNRPKLDEKMMSQNFGSYTLDSRSILSRDGKTLNLPPKEMALLELLLRHEGAIVSHELIEREIWPRQSVSYASLARCVYSLRQHLDDTRTILRPAVISA